MMKKRESMNNLNICKEGHKEYNNEPVFYCKHCLSLKVRYIKHIEDSEYCDECGSTDTGECSIEEWETLYKNKFGHKYLEEY